MLLRCKRFYSNKRCVVLFKCDWVRPIGVRMNDKFGITLVNFNHLHDASDYLRNHLYLQGKPSKSIM
jgi:hypothetical protein